MCLISACDVDAITGAADAVRAKLLAKSAGMI